MRNDVELRMYVRGYQTMNGPSRQRREEILTEVFEKRHVTAKELAARMNVSEATVRRDLKSLAEEGQVELVYGGATLRRPSDYSIRSKAMRNVEAKRVIGQLAAGLVGDDEQIFLDSGTTCFEMTPFLKRRRNLSIIVNSARLALELDAPGLSAIMLGGQYRADRMDCVGPLAIATLCQLRGYLCFIGADGLDMEFGLAAADIESANLHRLAVRNARQVVLLVDHTKFHALSLFKIVDWDQIHRVVTDAPPSPPWQQFLAQRNIEILHPGSVTAEISPASEVKAGL
jgi:DeoR/GlpR family transcriptional regulator of sugar metabolism